MNEVVNEEDTEAEESRRESLPGRGRGDGVDHDPRGCWTAPVAMASGNLGPQPRPWT